jgi:hypothetical protein
MASLVRRLDINFRPFVLFSLIGADLKIKNRADQKVEHPRLPSRRTFRPTILAKRSKRAHVPDDNEDATMADKELMEALGVLSKAHEAANTARRAPGIDRAIGLSIEEKRALRQVLKRYDEIRRPRKRRTIADTLIEDGQE